MPLSFFDYEERAHYREVVNEADRYGHSFGGDAAAQGIRFRNFEPIHLLYRLNQADPTVNLRIPGVRWLPLCYHFSFAAYEGELIYRVLSDTEIEVIAPTNVNFDASFPFPRFPRSFPQSSLTFQKQPYNAALAEDALKFAAVFGLDLPQSEIKRAIVVAERTCGTISEMTLPDFTDEDKLRWHREPFFQGAPSNECPNPQCDAEIIDRSETTTIAIDDPVFREVTGESSLTIEGRDILRVFAIHQPMGDDRVWPHVQLVFQICDSCRCIRVTNQCD